MGAAILLAAFVLNPYPSDRALSIFGKPIPSRCGFRMVTGIPCPSCGLTRSVTWSVRGDLGRAIAMHPLGPVFTLGILLQTVFAGLSLVVPRLRRF